MTCSYMFSLVYVSSDALFERSFRPENRLKALWLFVSMSMERGCIVQLFSVVLSSSQIGIKYPTVATIPINA